MRSRFKLLMNLHTLSPAPGSRKTRKRVGRGNSAGGGTTAGRGTKGQHSRRGSTRRFGFEGGQTPLLRRQPKLGGFSNPNRQEHEVLNLSVLEEKLAAGSYDQAALRELKVIRTKKPVKLLARGEVKKKFTLTVDAASKAASEAVAKAGGTVTISSH
jgi:large subunit ribosomal protein L15